MLALAVPSRAQEQPKEEDLYELSLEELMNVPINSASKKDETLFDAPLSSYTITRADIDKAGSTSIMEALRLAPGVIVREQTNGVYDIHIRGFDNILRTNEEYTKSNLATLVMIDNRPVFNNNLGGTFWESLPIDLNDVDRIEVVRGPSAPLFGPNAVTGVINIITKRPKDAGFMANANVQAATPSTFIANGSFGKKVGDRFNFVLSGNYQDRKRFDDTYYTSAALNTYVPVTQISTRPAEQYPNPDRAMNKYGANAFVNFKPADSVSVDVSLGLQKSDVQKNFLGGNQSTPFTTNRTESQYANIAASVYHFKVRGSFIMGTEDLNVASPPNKYDFKNTNAEAEYEIHFGKVATVVPGISYQQARYNDKDYYTVPTGSFLNGQEVTINTTSGFLRIDIRPVTALRVLAAVRVDKFSVPDKAYFAYEFATTYKLNESNLVRAALTRSNSGSFIGTSYLNLVIPTGPTSSFTRTGNQNLNLFRINMLELGFRSQLSKTVQLDIDVFHQKAENFTALIITSGSSQQFQNVPTVAKQTGITFSLNMVPSEKVQFKPFVTFQQTKTEALPDAYIINVTSTTDSDHKNTPSFYGGYYLNYKPGKKINVNLNGYYFAAHRQYSGDSPTNDSKAGDISGKFLVNLKAAYNITDKFNVFVNGRNILNSNSREYYATDQIGGVYAVGASFHLN